MLPKLVRCILEGNLGNGNLIQYLNKIAKITIITLHYSCSAVSMNNTYNPFSFLRSELLLLASLLLLPIIKLTTNTPILPTAKMFENVSLTTVSTTILFEIPKTRQSRYSMDWKRLNLTKPEMVPEPFFFLEPKLWNELINRKLIFENI